MAASKTVLGIADSDLLNCYHQISPYVHRTPVLTSRLIDDLCGANLYFKCENFQRTGSYKIRGATHAILQLDEKRRASGVVTHSSGNFAQALSKAAQSLGVPAYIVMPENAPEVKKAAVRTYEGQITECEPNLQARERSAARIAEETGAAFIHPSNDLQVILGQGTAAMELLEEQPELEVLMAPVGGGGLIAGTSLAAHFFADSCRVIGGEPFEVDDAYRSLKSGVIETNKTTNTIADGLKTQLGSNTFPIIKDRVEAIIRVSEAEIVSAMRLIWEYMKIVVEPSSAVALAAVLSEEDKFKGREIGLIISGGNVDLSKLPF